MSKLLSAVARRGVKLGVYTTPDQYRAALTREGKMICPTGDLFLEQVSVSPVEKTIYLIYLLVRDLGFDNGARVAYMNIRATEMGLALCPAEVGPALCLGYPDQPRGEVIRLAMDPLVGRFGSGIFCIEHSPSGQWLSASEQRPDDFLLADYGFLFVASSN